MRFDQRLDKIEKAISNHGKEVFLSIKVPWDLDPENFEENRIEALKKQKKPISKNSTVVFCTDYSGASIK